MKPELEIEIERTRRILKENDLEFSLGEPASPQKISEIEMKLGVSLDENLKDLWLLTNGSNGNGYWFAVVSDELTFCEFTTIEEALKSWSWFEPYDQNIYEEWSDFEAKRDERIQPHVLKHRLWLPFAEFNGFSTSLMFDADPTKHGNYGQIIVYQHDPDAIYYVEKDFLTFYKKSNDLLEAELPDFLNSLI